MLLHQLRRDSGSQQLPQVLLPGLPVQTGTAETRGSPAFKLKAEASERTKVSGGKQ